MIYSFNAGSPMDDSGFVYFALTSAGMVELADTTDLKSVAPKEREGSSPSPGTI